MKKDVLKTICRYLKRYWKGWIFFAGLVAALLAILLSYKLPDRCALCEGIRYHAPCMVNLTTGEVVEMELYEPHPTLVAEISSFQPGGDLSFLYGAGLKLIRNRGSSWTIETSLSGNRGYIKFSEFCYLCRWRLLKCGFDRYAVVDLYDRKHPAVYSVRNGAAYDMRCYTVTVSKEKEYTVSVEGKLEK